MALSSIAIVAGAINVGILFLQLTSPLLLTLILVGVIGSTNSAVTWTMISRSLQSTSLPTILKTDSTAGPKHGVNRRVLVINYLTFLSFLLVGVAAVLTPIGLHEVIVDGFVDAQFAYVKDFTIFGQGTPDRSAYVTTRTCNSSRTPCPGVNVADVVPLTNPGSSPGFGFLGYQNYIPKNLVDIFSSGTRGKADSRASPFDIQFRQYTASRNEANLTAVYNTTGQFHWTASLILEQQPVLVEGLVVDPVSGGVGFRNHTVPVNPEMNEGAKWTEDLLWIDVQTACVSTNWSISAIGNPGPFSSGGLARWTNGTLRRSSPGRYRGTNPEFAPFEDLRSQTTVNLADRARLAAEIFDYHLSAILYLDASNISSSIYPLDFDLAYSFLGFGSGDTVLQLGNLPEPSWLSNNLSGSEQPPEFLNLTGMGFNLSAFDVYAFFAYMANVSQPGNPIETVPTANLSDALKTYTWDYGLSACKGLTGFETPRLGMPHVECGYLISPPFQNSSTPLSADGTHAFESSVFVCASSPVASVKEVSLTFNATAKQTPLFSNLQVEKIVPKKYNSTQDMPIWGQERYNGSLSISQFNPLWGIVDSSVANSSTLIETVQNDIFFLLASVENGFDIRYGDSNAAARVPPLILSIVYGNLTVNDIASNYYSGSLSSGLVQRWMNLSSSPETVHKIPGLIWTDYAANMLVGAKAMPLIAGNEPVLVKRFKKKVAYNYLYSIPAMICCFIWLLSSLLLLWLLAFQKGWTRLRPGYLKWIINRLSAGRAFAEIGYPGDTDQDAPTKTWLAQAKDILVEIKRPDKEKMDSDNATDDADPELAASVAASDYQSAASGRSCDESEEEDPQTGPNNVQSSRDPDAITS